MKQKSCEFDFAINHVGRSHALLRFKILKIKFQTSIESFTSKIVHSILKIGSQMADFNICSENDEAHARVCKNVKDTLKGMSSLNFPIGESLSSSMEPHASD